MKIRQLKLKNVGCLADRTVDFSDLTMIYGENRSGKSTLVYAIFFALFGKHLNSSLRRQDLCRIGEKNASFDLILEEKGEPFRVRRFTDRLPRIYRKEGEEWTAEGGNAAEILQKLIPPAPETAALTSFFRESELIYFLQEVPRYGKTLMQSFIGIDRVLILRSVFKKAYTRAREYRKGVLNAAPGQKPDPLQTELIRRQLELAETDLKKRDSDYERLLQPASDQQLRYRMQQEQYKEKAAELDKLQKKQTASLPLLEKELKEKESIITDAQTLSHSLEEMLRHTGALSQEKRRIKARLQKLAALEEQGRCPLCEHVLEKERIKELLTEGEKEVAAVSARQKETDEKLRTVLDRKKAVTDAREDAEKLRRQIQESADLEKKIWELRQQMDGLAAEIREKAPDYGEKEEKTSESYRQKLEAARKSLQDEIVQHKVRLTRNEELLRRIRDNEKHRAEAERNVLICKTAYQAMDAAIRELGGRLMEEVRQSVRNWSAHFSFLHNFDIEISGNELLPIIQASGYTYKLNQMSKSERIFLYLMLKLAVGDALGHPGIFVLDDPADGLDQKRKQTLAYLLREVARKRQVIVTSNDREFADLFADAGCLRL